MGYRFNPFTSTFDRTGVNPSGDTMTGDLELGDCKQLILQSCDNSLVAGSPIGLGLLFTYAATTGTIKRWGLTIEHATGALITTEL